MVLWILCRKRLVHVHSKHAFSYASGLRPVLLVIVLFTAASICRAQAWSLPLFTADPHAVLEAAGKYRVPEGSPATILDRSVSADIDEAGRLHTTTRTVAKVLRVRGIELFQKVTLTWPISRETRPVIKARVITSDGQPHVLDQARLIEQDPANPNLVGVVKLMAAVLPDVDIDSVIELEVDETDREPAMPGQRFSRIELYPGLAIQHFRATITSAGPTELRVEIRAFPAAKVVPMPNAKGRAFSVEVLNFQSTGNGDLLPPDVPPNPAIIFTNAPSWQAVAQWYATTIRKSVAAASVPAPGTNDTVQAAEKAYEEMRKHVEDNGLVLETSPILPRPPEDVLKSGSGDSLDQAALLVSKLSQAGIAAKVALVSSAPATDVLPSMPGLEAFSRALVYVPGSTPLWIDPAAEFTPVTHLPVADQDRWALVIDPATTQLVRTPVSSQKDNQQSTATDIVVGDGFPTKVSTRTEAEGSFGDDLRPLLSQLADAAEKSDERRRDALLSPMFHRVGGQRIDSTKSSDAHQLLGKSWLEIAGEGYSPSGVSDEGGYVDLPGLAQLDFQAFKPLFASSSEDSNQPFTKERKGDYYVAPRFTTVNSFHLTPPPGYRLKEVSPIAPVTLGPLSVVTSANIDKDGSLRLSYTLTQSKTRISPLEIEAMRAKARSITDSKHVGVQFENVALAKLNAGDVAAGLQLLKQDAQTAKDTVNPALRLAGGYVQVGARDAGVSLCDNLLKTRPVSKKDDDSALAAIHSRLGWIYEHDPFGRFMFPGMDADLAEKNLKQAGAMRDLSAWMQLAGLYTFNTAGIHFGRGSRLDEAVGILNRIDLNALAHSGRLNEYALLLLNARKYVDLREFFLYSQGDAADQSIKWAALAASRSDSELKEELEFRYPSPNDRRVLLVSAGRLLIAAREYAGALRAFKLAGVGPGVSEADLERLARVHEFNDTGVSKDGAVAAFQRYVEAVLNPETADDWKKFVTPESQNSTVQVQRNSLLQYFGGLMPGIARPEFWPYISDVVNTATAITAEGNDAPGFRIKISPNNNDPSAVVAYVVKRGNDYLVAGLANSNATSVQAVRCARGADASGARRWLDWGRQAANRPNLSDAEFQKTIEVATAQSLLDEGKAQQAADIMLRIHQNDPADRGSTFLLSEALIQSNRPSDAKQYIDALEPADPALALRLRAHLLAHNGDYNGAAAVEKQICDRPNAAPADWNDLAWTILFTGQNAAAALQAAEKAAQLTNSSIAPVLHTLAVAQANAGRLKEAIATGYQFQDVSGDRGELQTIFGRIAEELQLVDTAREYYSSVPKQNGAAFSNYSFAQSRLSRLPPQANISTSLQK